MTENTNSQERIAQVLEAVAAAQQLQADWLHYGIDCIDRYVDVEGEWWETSDEEYSAEERKEEMIEFLSSEDKVAVRVRERLKVESMSQIAAALETCLGISSEQERTYGVKNILAGSLVAIVREESVAEDEEIEILDLAEDLLEKLDEIFGVLDPEE
ncbi:MAG: hypothetical protein AB4352_06310 [Hormoscilla sp.]